MSKLNIVIAGLAVVALVIGLKLWHQAEPEQSSSHELNAHILAPPKDIPKFSLLDSAGKPFNNNTLWAHWTFLVFGRATHSTEEVSQGLTELNKAVNSLAAQKQTPIPQVFFVSMDPASDSLDALKKYTSKFNPNFVGATGDPKQIALLSQQVPPTTKFAFLLLDPSGKLVGIFPTPHRADLIVNDFKIIVQNAG